MAITTSAAIARNPKTAAATFTMPTMSAARGTGGVWAWRALGVLLIVAAALSGAIAASTWDDVAIEGAYLNRSVGAPATSAVFSSTAYPGAGRIWLGVAIGLAAAGVLVLALSVWLSRARRRAPEPQAPVGGPAL